MKHLYFFCTKLWYYIAELPLIALLAIALIYNDTSKEILKLYPLIIFLCAAIIFVFLYFFRFIKINREEVRSTGVFSARESALIKKGRSLKLTLRKNFTFKAELYGLNEAPTLEWIDPEEYKDTPVNLFRARAVGSTASVKRVLKYFSVDESSYEMIFSSEDFESLFDKITLRAYTENENRVIELHFNETP